MGRTDDPGFLAVGHVSKPHGIDGEVVVHSLTDHPEGTFTPGVVLRLADPQGRLPDPDAPPLRIVTSRPHQGTFLVKFGGIESRNDAEVLRGAYLLRAGADVTPLADGEVFQHQLIGMSVYTVAGELLGRVTELYELVPFDMLEVRGEGGEYLIPFRSEIVREMDAEGGRLVVDPPEGLLDL